MTSDAELRALYQNATVFLFPSLTEGFGLPPIEAMHCGTAAIVGRGGATPEVCKDGALLLDPLDKDAWSGAIVELIENSDTRERLVQNGTARARELTWDNAGEVLWHRIRQYL